MLTKSDRHLKQITTRQHHVHHAAQYALRPS